jgi:hypothetical protein
VAELTLIKSLEASTSVQAWIQACELLLSQRGKAAFNLIVGVKDPVSLSASDRIVASRVDSFLRRFECQPLVTVMNTIFPGGFYKQGGSAAVYEEFPEAYSQSKTGWGTYAGRIFSKMHRRDGEEVSRISTIVEKLKRNNQPGGLRMKASYEVDVIDSSQDEDVSLYCAETDSTQNRGLQPCLAHLSFKLHADDVLSLTAFYRSQYYITKGLGNFLGLGQLLYFVATEAGLKPGWMVVHASMAEIDSKSEAPRWNAEDIECLIHPRQIQERVTTAERALLV